MNDNKGDNLIHDPIALLRAISDGNFFDIPSKDASERRDQCNRILQSTEAILAKADADWAANVSNEIIGNMIISGNANKAVLAEARKRLQASS